MNAATANYYFSCAFLATHPLLFISFSSRGATGWFTVGVREYRGGPGEGETRSGACAVLGVARRRDGELEGDSASRR